MLWDSETKIKRILELPEPSGCCAHKKYWSKALQDNKVDAVLVRLIGTNMLSTLFKLNVCVLSVPRGFDLENVDVSQLTPVTQIEFARPSAKKNKTCYSGHDSDLSSPIDILLSSNHEATSNKKAPVNKLSPSTMNHLTKIFKLNT
ncbi:NifB/NifX family molybdenum-iron cluster-binding protein [Aliivibrio kagoshimensis]